MENHFDLLISPVQVPRNCSLTIRSEHDHFWESEYVITDENERIIRKGFIEQSCIEFKLSMVGLMRGVYWFKMGAVQKKFVVLG